MRRSRATGRDLETTSLADGSWRLEDLPPNEDLVVRAALGEAEAPPSAAFRLDGADPSPVRLVLAATGRLSGLVEDLATRAAVDGARVTVEPVGAPVGRERRDLRAGSDGRFEVGGLVPGRWRVVADRRRDHLPGEPRELEVTPAPPSTVVTLTLDPGLVIAGYAVDADGRPVQGVRASLSGVEDLVAGAAAALPVSKNVSTDASGAFRFATLRSGSYRLALSKAGYAGTSVGLRGGEDRLRLVLEPQGGPR